MNDSQLLRYARHAAERMDIRKEIQFDTRVTRACYAPMRCMNSLITAR